MLIDCIYIEDAVAKHPRTRQILERYPQATRIPCARYQEVFNPHTQNFRLQKQRPALILAQKEQGRVLPTPPDYGIGHVHNYYFSHMLNCLYDCRYCFLQGMYQSAHYVLFVNFEDFQNDIAATLSQHPNQDVAFFSGYDCDSLAMNPLSHFSESFLPFFARHPQAHLELRTKSRNVQPLLKREPLENVICAFTLSPAAIARDIEHGAPSLPQRLRAMQQLAERGWLLGLRFDPILYRPKWQQEYSSFFKEVFAKIPIAAVHSATLGSLRMPKPIYKNMKGLYPRESLFSLPFAKQKDTYGYPSDLDQQMQTFCLGLLESSLPSERIFPMVA